MISNHDTDEPANPRVRRLMTLACVLAIPLAIIWWPGCREYPTVTSKESLQLMKRLYAACNTRNEKWLAEVETKVQELHSQGKMTEAEGSGFAKIIALARAGDWQKAQDAAFKFAQDQIGHGHPADSHDHQH